MAFSSAPTDTAEFSDLASGNSYQLTLDIAAGSLVVIMGKSDDGPTAPDTWTVSSLDDDSPDAGAWEVIAYSDSGNSTQQTRVFAAWKYFPTGGSGVVIDATISANREFRRALGAVYSSDGIGVTLEDFDAASSGTNTTNLDAGVVDALTGDLVVGFINKYIFGGTFTPDAGFDIAAQQADSAARPSFIIDRVADSDTTYTVGGTNTSSCRYAGVAAVFREVYAVELDGAISSESTVEGSLQLTVGLQGELTSVSTVQGSLGLAMPLEGAVSSVSRLSGSLGIPTVLQGTIDSASDTAGTLGLVQGLTGTIASASQVQGQFALATALTGAIASASNLAGDLTVAGDMSLVGTASSVSTVQGRLSLATGLAGIAESTSQAAGGLGLNLLLSSEVRSVSGVHGGIGLSTPLSGTISSESVLSGELSIAGANALAGTINSVSALRGELNLSIGLAGSSRSESSLSSELTISGALALNGTISSVSRLSGALSLGPYIDLQESITLGAYGSVRIYSNGTRLFTV